MGIFRKKRSSAEEVAKEIDEQLEQPVSEYDTALDFMVGLSDQEYKKLHEVADIYRAANKKASKVLGIKQEPSNSLNLENPDKTAIYDKYDQKLLEDELDAGLSNLSDSSSVVDHKKPARKVK